MGTLQEKVNHRESRHASVLDWIQHPAQAVGAVNPSDAERPFMWRALAYFDLIVSHRLAIHQTQGRRLPRIRVKDMGAAGYEIEVRDTTDHVTRYPFLVTAPVRRTYKRSTQRKSTYAAAALTAKALRSMYTERHRAIPASVAAAHPGKAPSDQTRRWFDRLNAELLASATKRLMRCASPRCAVLGGALFFRRTSESDCPQCRTDHTHKSRWGDRHGLIKKGQPLFRLADSNGLVISPKSNARDAQRLYRRWAKELQIDTDATRKTAACSICQLLPCRCQSAAEGARNERLQNRGGLTRQTPTQRHHAKRSHI